MEGRKGMSHMYICMLIFFTAKFVLISTYLQTSTNPGYDNTFNKFMLDDARAKVMITVTFCCCCFFFLKKKKNSLLCHPYLRITFDISSHKF